MSIQSAVPLPARKSLRTQLWASIALIVALLTASFVFLFYELDIRKHDYLILNLAGQLRVATRSLLEDSRRASLHKDSSGDLRAYGDSVRNQAVLIDRIVHSFRDRKLDPELLGKTEPIYCTWDAQSRSQMDVTADDWESYRGELAPALEKEPSPSALALTAQRVSDKGDLMAVSADHLALAFQSMMEAKLNLIRLFQSISGVGVILLLLGIGIAAQRRVLRPLEQAVAGFARVARGDMGHQVPVLADNEIGRLSIAFNTLSERLNLLFRLTDRINQGNTLDHTLGFVLEAFREFFPVDWVGVFFAIPERDDVVLERMTGLNIPGLREGDTFNQTDKVFSEAVRNSKPNLIADIGKLAADTEITGPGSRLFQAGISSMAVVPLLEADKIKGLMVFAAREQQAYTSEDMDFLGNITAQVGHVLDKTVIVEGLVVAALQGLAKLAESRDPETGDHLVRMSLYSAIVAETLGHDSRYQKTIDAAYVRNLQQFAPMHDIGKVGIADSILLKPGRLDPEERAEMERHPVIGGLALRRCEAQMNVLGHSIFAIGIEIAECHHEKFDGSGYPAGLAGDAIPLSARIVAVADVFDALTSKRPYKDAWSVERALATIVADAGTHFDPDVVAAMQRALPKIMDVYERLKHV
ncbi:GAF domain-containing protein [Candidatus Methylospira mobilis]|uniref:GAF domain-containing protein n=1 Tax=Candidatus Methylospira mobilis TaxID=1808979 RepID=A0A5Q0BB56_9GAMM|nr:HD domain-containing phosphohydrolase [Candidatus Methylospira mobilis]QFY41193.1 GAF domain-containing protein [Candidatus Methylospira mobilis]